MGFGAEAVLGGTSGRRWRRRANVACRRDGVGARQRVCALWIVRILFGNVHHRVRWKVRCAPLRLRLDWPRWRWWWRWWLLGVPEGSASDSSCQRSPAPVLLPCAFVGLRIIISHQRLCPRDPACRLTLLEHLVQRHGRRVGHDDCCALVE